LAIRIGNILRVPCSVVCAFAHHVTRNIVGVSQMLQGRWTSGRCGANQSRRADAGVERSVADTGSRFMFVAFARNPVSNEILILRCDVCQDDAVR
jgi:hypothetical protein